MMDNFIEVLPTLLLILVRILRGEKVYSLNIEMISENFHILSSFLVYLSKSLFAEFINELKFELITGIKHILKALLQQKKFSSHKFFECTAYRILTYSFCRKTVEVLLSER